MFKKSPTTYYYFAKRDPDETICEKITRLNILPNQFYALAIFSASTRGGRGRGAREQSIRQLHVCQSHNRPHSLRLLRQHPAVHVLVVVQFLPLMCFVRFCPITTAFAMMKYLFPLKWGTIKAKPSLDSQTWWHICSYMPFTVLGSKGHRSARS